MTATKQASPAAEQWREIFKALFRYHSLPEAPVHLMLTTRTFFKATDVFMSRLRQLCEPEDTSVPFGSYPFRAWNLVFNHGTTARWGMRACVPAYSPQVVVHESESETDLILMEWDCDLYNPDAGLYYVVQHEIHDVMLKRSRDPWKMRAGMVGRFKGLDIPLISKE